MAKVMPLGMILSLSLVSLLVLSGQAAGVSTPIALQSIRATQGGTPNYVNVSLNTTDVFAFTSGKVTLNITSDGAGTLVVNITNADGMIIPVANVEVNFTATNQIYEVTFTSAWGALPGTFTIQVSAWYLNVTNGNSLDPVLTSTVNVTLGMGVMLGLPILLAIVVIAIIMAVKLRKPAGAEKTEEKKKESSSEGTAVTSGVANKIRCPECKKLIDEGSVFCAECGARVPEFLRYNTPQT